MALRSVLLLCLVCPLLVHAGADIEPVEAIRAVVLANLEAGVEAELTLDDSLRMPRCQVPLQAQRQGTATIDVICPRQWHLYVPVKQRRQQRVLVLTRGVAAGETVNTSMLTQELRPASQIVGMPLSDLSEATGQVLRRGLVAGSVLTAGHLVSPRLVRRGDNVTLVARRGGIEVRMTGRALHDAGLEERVSVQNLSSRRTIQGRVLADGEVLALN